MRSNSLKWSNHHKSKRVGYHQTEFAISDTGIGMSKDQMKNIWERYYKADPSRKNTKYGESGLGMAIVHQLMGQTVAPFMLIRP